MSDIGQWRCPVGDHPMVVEKTGQYNQELIVMHDNGRGGVCGSSGGPIHPSWRPLQQYVKPSSPTPPVVVDQMRPSCICIDNRDHPDCLTHGKTAKLTELRRQIAELESSPQENTP
jgi:hypothetical protein